MAVEEAEDEDAQTNTLRNIRQGMGDQPQLLLRVFGFLGGKYDMLQDIELYL